MADKTVDPSLLVYATHSETIQQEVAWLVDLLTSESKTEIFVEWTGLEESENPREPIQSVEEDVP